MEKKLKEEALDVGYDVIKHGLGLLTFLGIPANIVFEMLVSPPIEKRLGKWREEVGERIKLLEEKKDIDVKELKENDLFIDVLINATQEALKTSEEEKLECLRNAVLNTAFNQAPEISEIQIFIRLISDFTVWHIRILKLYDDPIEYFQKNGITMKDYAAAGLVRVLLEAYPELRGKSEFYNLIWSDLKQAGLVDSMDLGTTMTGRSLMITRTTGFGKKFLSYIRFAEAK